MFQFLSFVKFAADRGANELNENPKLSYICSMEFARTASWSIWLWRWSWCCWIYKACWWTRALRSIPSWTVYLFGMGLGRTSFLAIERSKYGRKESISWIHKGKDSEYEALAFYLTLPSGKVYRASLTWSSPKAAKQFMRRLIPEVINLQSSYGGPIIAVQVENEYGMYYNSEQNHLRRVF